jgi:hypothetical protein
VFAAAGLGSLPVPGRVDTARAAARVSEVFHALMCTALIAMTWRSEPAGPARSAMPAMSPHAAPAAVLAVCVLLAAYFALPAVPWFVCAIGPGRRVTDRPAAGHAAMSAGMAAMLLAML